MGHLDEYTIPFKGLAAGQHRFEFRIGDRFFEEIEYSEIKHGDVEVDLLLIKEETMLSFTFSIGGSVLVVCDRCGDEYLQPISGEEKLFVKFGKEYAEESEQVIILPWDEHQFDIRHLIYEYINLLLPYRRIHPEDADGKALCNAEALRKIDQLASEKAPDPRWEVLKEFREKTKKRQKAKGKSLSNLRI